MIIECLKNINTREKIFNCLSFLTILVAFLFIALFTFWKIYPYEPMVINKRPLNVTTKEVSRGDTLIYKLDYCKNIDLPVEIRRRFVDGVIYSMPDISANTKKGCRVLDIALNIPEKLPTGEYILTVTYIYQVNPIRTIEVNTHTEKFKVIN